MCSQLVFHFTTILCTRSSLDGGNPLSRRKRRRQWECSSNLSLSWRPAQTRLTPVMAAKCYLDTSV